MREFTRLDFRLTNRGSGRPLGPSVTVWAALWAWVGDAPATMPSTTAPRTRRRRAKPDNTFVPYFAMARCPRSAQAPLFLCLPSPCLLHEAAGGDRLPVSPFWVKEVSTDPLSRVRMTGKKKPLVVITRKLPDPVETRMRELFDARLNVEDRPLTQPELVAAVKEADVLVPTITDTIDAALIAQAGENLKLIANFGNGVDKIDVAAAAKKGITVTNTPNVLTEDTADMTMALILAVPRRLAEGANVLPGGKGWPGWSPTWMLGRRIWGKRLGIVGMGRIGTAVARRAKAFGLSIHYHNRHRVMPALEDELEATYWESLDQMLARMDIISVNCPSTPATFHLLSARRLALLQRTAYIVNTARGDIIDEEALVKLLQEDRIAG